MLAKILLWLLIYLNLFANNTLENTYYVESKVVKLSSIIPNVKNDFYIITIESSRFSKKIRSKEFIEQLKRHGYTNYSSKSRYVNFILKSPIDTSKIESSVRDYYQQQYKNIDIQKILIKPRSFISKLPEDYVINIGNREYLKRSGTLSIKTPDRKKIFFNYDVTATLPVYISRKKIKKDVELSAINSTKKSIILDKFRAKPIQDIQKAYFQTKHHMPKDRLLTIRDVELLRIVKRNSLVNVNMHSDNISITFSAKALQDGKVNDIISVQKHDGKKLKVRVIGKNRAEMR